VKRVGWLLLLCLTILLLSACGDHKIPGAKNWPVGDFTFTDQDGRPFGLSNLKGKVWVADFIFTHCPDVCPMMTANMANLQRMAKKEGLNVEFVSFSVDPENDKPEVLKQYAQKFHGDLSNWHFLTGYSQQTIETFAKKNFKTTVNKPEHSDMVMHGVYFYLIDRNGKILKYYQGSKDVPYEEILKHMKVLQE